MEKILDMVNQETKNKEYEKHRRNKLMNSEEP
jgi:hypothetical protein